MIGGEREQVREAAVGGNGHLYLDLGTFFDSRKMATSE